MRVLLANVQYLLLFVSSEIGIADLGSGWDPPQIELFWGLPFLT